jgi:hypothetical protein
MLRQSILVLGAYAAVFMSAGAAGAEDLQVPLRLPQVTFHPGEISLHCSRDRQGGDPPWISDMAKNYLINLSGSTVNGEILQIDRINPKQITWNKPADASVPAARYDLDFRSDRLLVLFGKVEYDGRKFASATVLLQGAPVRLKLAA